MTTFERCYTTIKFQIRMYTIVMSIWLVYNYVSQPLDHSQDLFPNFYALNRNTINNNMEKWIPIHSGNTSNGHVNISYLVMDGTLNNTVHFPLNFSITVASSIITIHNTIFHSENQTEWVFYEYLGRLPIKAPPKIWFNLTNNSTLFLWLFDELMIINETTILPFNITLMLTYCPMDHSSWCGNESEWIFGNGSNITNASISHNLIDLIDVSDFEPIYIHSVSLNVSSIDDVFPQSSIKVYQSLSDIQSESVGIKNEFDKRIMKLILIGTFAYLVINFIFVALFVVNRVRGMFGHKKQYIRLINPLNIDNILQNKQHTDNQLRKFVMSWNKQPKRTNVNLNSVIKCFQDNHIDNIYFETHTRKQFMELIKKQCHVKASAAAALWKHFKNKNTTAFNNVNKKELDVVAEIVNNLKKEIENLMTVPNYLDVIVEILSDSEQLKDIINVTKWETISTFCKNSKHAVSFILSIEKSEFAKRCIDCMIIHQNNIQLVPILVFDCNQNKNCVYYVSIVRIIEDSDIGIAFEYHPVNKRISVRSIYLDKDGIQERNAFILPYRTYICLDNFASNITQLNIGWDAKE
eukprot:460497_1